MKMFVFIITHFHGFLLAGIPTRRPVTVIRKYGHAETESTGRLCRHSG